MSKAQKPAEQIEIPYSQTKEAKAKYRKDFYEKNKKKVLDAQKDYLYRKKNGLPLKTNETKLKEDEQREKWRIANHKKRRAKAEQSAKDFLDNYNTKYGNPHELTENQENNANEP